MTVLNAFAGNSEIAPQAVPTAATAVTGVNAHLKNVTVSNPTGGAIAFTLKDQQASPNRRYRRLFRTGQHDGNICVAL
jgi:hypothetical protein